ncbi:hypothetical protein A2V55_02135 [Candidatus Woesebacteria bacterium RBG_19FT_COMBO_37_29]|uniref:7 transmembrane helices usually fused to an inactive transglutaminase domain-containing protein n=1 Tax=Candidatus Woesebacteria bacterium RBG_19FT_COMBO_37_29 TaxID=1802486 RepID=A0A1F7XLG3_9BACT|nr:MAG: hypothetical protein A2V55_02135 [Candidatus Woesebacteria bacterium RBG_19FT_COMBO_37_29]
MRRTILLVIFVSTALISFGLGTRLLKAQNIVFSPTPTPVILPTPQETVVPASDITQPTQETLGPLEKMLEEQVLGSIWPKNPIKYAIRTAVESGVPANTIVLLLLLPVIAAIIAAARHLIGLRGFGIFLPAALSVTFVATGPVVGIGLFLIIIMVSILIRFILRKVKIKLQYLPRMALLLLFVVFAVLSILFAAPIIRRPELTNVSIFAVLILVLLAEDFTRVQLGKSAKVAINLTTETLILALVSYMFLTLEPLQKFALLNPEILILSVAVFDFLLGKYAGLRFLEFWRFRKLING